MSLTVTYKGRVPTALPILQNIVAVPAWHRAGHSVEELPTEASFKENLTTLFDIRDYPEVLARVNTTDDGRRVPVGIWHSDLIRYEREETWDLQSWILKKFQHWSEYARQELFWREARPVAIVERMIAKNIVTDSGAAAMLKVIGTAAPTLFYNHMQLSADAKVIQISATSASAQATINVAAGGTVFTNTMNVYVGFGLGTQESKAVSSSTATTIVCTTNLANTHNATEWVVQEPGTVSNAAVDNPASVTSGYDSGALAAGAFTYSGTGPGARQVQVVFNFAANASAPAGGYTDLWLASAATIASNTTGVHLTRSPLAVNGSTGANVTYTDTI